MICCIDSNIFIWGIKKRCELGQEEMLERASYLFEWIDTNGYKVMIPSIVIAEVLAPEPLEKHPVLMDIINKNFIIADFDVKSASQYGVLFMNKIDELKALAASADIDKQKMKTDHLIVASAIAGGANCIYSNDNGLKVFGNKYIEVRDLPFPPAKPLTLF